MGFLEWREEGAKVVSFLDGTECLIEADSLVLATVNRADDRLARDLETTGIELRTIGDCVAPRQAAYAIYEGRKVALEL